MRMTIENAARLNEIMGKPSLTARDQVIICRRLARHHAATYAHHRVELSAQAQAADGLLKEGYEALLKDWHETHDKMMCDIGEFLVECGPDVEREVGKDGLLDLLNVNPVHRAEVLAQQKSGRDFLHTIAGFCGMEDSAEQYSGRRQRHFKDGPLFGCYLELGCRWVKQNPGRLTDALTAPGGMLHGIPVYRERQDGSLTRQAPALTLHRADGSTRVVQRAPQVVGSAPEDGLITPREPQLDELTHVQLLALLTDLVKIREAETDPARHAALTTVTGTLCRIIERHEPKEPGHA